LDSNRHSSLGRRSFLQNSLLTAAAGATGLIASAPEAEAKSYRTIVIDAGHGGHDLGAHEGRVFEKHLNLDVSRRLEIQLKRRGFRTVMTRDRDVFIPLLTRSSISNKYRSNLFVSIHFNSSWKSHVDGIETFYYSYTGYQLAAAVQTDIIRKLRAENRGVKRASFSVLRNTSCPAILVEGGFVSNSQERGKMLQAWYRQALAESVAKGIADFAR